MSSLPAEAVAYVTDWLGPDWTAEPLAGDASVRAYYRIATPGGSYILTYYPEEVRPQLRHFLRAYDAVAPHSRIPTVLAHGEMVVLQHDVGRRTLYDVLYEDRDEGVRLYRAAIELLAGFQEARTELNRPFTADSFLIELEMAREFYVELLTGIGDSESLKPILKKLADKVARHPFVLCHRDFHGQNLHVNDGVVYLIDYQDLRMGPHTYDMAALLRDRGVARVIGDATELELLEYYGSLIGADGGLHDCYFETLLQRSIKILGTFSRQPITRGRMHYLEFIPPTLESIERCLSELPEWRVLGRWFPNEFSIERAAARVAELQRSH